MKKILTLFILSFIASQSYSQKYGNIWHFGDHVGIDFNSCTPLPLNEGNNIGFEGCATICNNDGQLLFYTNSDTVWNKMHQAMPNGFLVGSSGTLSQVLIVQQPSHDSLYYIFTTKIQASGSLSLQYHVVNMNLNAGLGDIMSKNNVLSTLNITEQVAATYHSNLSDIWVMAHEYPTNNFLCFKLTSTGISTTPIVSTIGSSFVPCISNFNSRGEMKFSPDGKRIAINNNGVGNVLNSDILSVFDFNSTTGVVSNEINLPAERGGFGISFSPDNLKLYGATWKAFSFTPTDSNSIFQFDLSSGNPSIISNSKIILHKVPTSQQTFGAVKLGPDGKIYIASNNESYLGVILNPNNAGTACNYVNNGYYVGQSKVCRFGLNNYIEYTNYCFPLSSSNIEKDKLELTICPNPVSNQLVISSSRILSNASAIILNSIGMIIKSINVIDSNSLHFQVSDLPAGLYNLLIEENGEILKTSTFLKN